MFYSFKFKKYNIKKLKKISLKKCSWSFCMGSLQSMMPILFHSLHHALFISCRSKKLTS